MTPAGDSLPFDRFCERLERVESLSADTTIVAEVAALFETAGSDLPVVARFVQGRVLPGWDGTTLDVGPRLLYTVLARAAGPNVSADDVETRIAETGDVGDVATELNLGAQQGLAAFTDAAEEALTVDAVDRKLRAVASAEGSGSDATRADRLFGLFNRCSPVEARYLARLLVGEMRIGVGTGAVRDGTVEAFDVDATAVERALQVSNDYGEVARVARDEGIRGLQSMELTVGRPIQAMLAQAGTADDALDTWETVAVETKFDGARVQLHYTGDDTRVFSRNMTDVTGALPEVTEFAARALDVPVILDGEVVAVDDDDGDPLPFQEVLRRFRRKHAVDEAREAVSVAIRLFDCLHVDGRDLLSERFLDRREHLAEHVAADASGCVSDVTLASTLEEIERHEAAALADGHEGIMLKNPASAYTPGRRGKNWLKRKPDVETLDLVVTGAEWGEGRRASFLGTFEVSAQSEEGFAPVGNVATGITDETLEELTAMLRPAIERESGKRVELRPELVLEVGYEEIQTSERYDSGFALRFPRLVAIREKAPDAADSLERIRRLAGVDS